MCTKKPSSRGREEWPPRDDGRKGRRRNRRKTRKSSPSFLDHGPVGIERGEEKGRIWRSREKEDLEWKKTGEAPRRKRDPIEKKSVNARGGEKGEEREGKLRERTLESRPKVK